MSEVQAEAAIYLFQITRDELLAVLKQVSGVVEQSQVMQILSYVLLSGDGQSLSVLASNSEVEVATEAKLFSPTQAPFSITVSCRKLMDICRTLPEGALIDVKQSEQWVVIHSAGSQFRLATLPGESFPRLPEIEGGHAIEVVEADLKDSTERSCFSMACQDARFFLNGMLLEISDGLVQCVSTDGHRLSWRSFPLSDKDMPSPLQVIIPRKTVLELSRLLRTTDSSLELVLGSQSIEVRAAQFRLRSNLIEGQYPKYRKLIPSSPFDSAEIEVVVLKQALDRVAILANEKFKGARFYFEQDSLRIVSSNFDQEEAVALVPMRYSGKARSVAFNITYVLDVLNVLKSDVVMFQFSDSMQGVLIEDASDEHGSYVVMPLTL